MDARLTSPDGDYCRDKCGQEKTCKRLRRGDRCENALIYEKLRQYENREAGTYTVFAYNSDGTTADFVMCDSKNRAIDFARGGDWEDVINDSTGEVVWSRKIEGNRMRGSR